MADKDCKQRDPEWLWTGRVPSLDGLRAISILLVVWHHIAVQFGARWPKSIRILGNTGSLGVDVFFVISGFLITLLLVRERHRTGRTALFAFYVRRIFRIMPAYFVYLCVIGGLLAFSSSNFSPSEWLRACTYSISLFSEPSWYIGHAWSLSVEEHFYLIWPILFIILPRNLLFFISFGYTFFAVGLRFVFTRYIHVGANLALFSPIRMDTIAAGSSLALIATSRFRARLFLPLAASATASVTGLFIIFFATLLHNRPTQVGAMFSDLGFRFVVEWCIVVLVWVSLLQWRSPVGRLLNSRILVVLGTMSYSIYLWQQPFLGPIQPFWMFKLPGNLIVILIFGSASYFFVEQPFLRLKTFFEPTFEARDRSDAENEVFVKTPIFQPHHLDNSRCFPLESTECQRSSNA